MLRVIVKLMLAFAALVALWVILSPLFRTNVQVNVKPVETVIDVSEIAEDSIDIMEWFDKPLIIARWSDVTLNRLQAIPYNGLRDADNKNSLQPDTTDKLQRSVAPGWFVAIGIGTSSGCALAYQPEILNNRENAVFVDPCDGSRYDFAGRALSGSVAKKNIPVPHWRIDGSRIVVSTEPVRP